MAYVAKDDIIAFIDGESNFIQGNSQTYDIILYKDFIGSVLNLNQPTSFNVAVYVEDKKVLQFSRPSVSGVSVDLDVDLVDNTGKISFNINETNSTHLSAGRLYAQVSVYYENYYPQPKNYVFPRLLIGDVINNPNIDNGDPSGETGGGTTTIIERGPIEAEFQVEHIDGSDPSDRGMVSMSSADPALVDFIIFRNLDKNGIRISGLENFLTKRISGDNINGIITINDIAETNMYAIYRVESWERLDLNVGGGDADNLDGVKINVSLEMASTGPGVTQSTWQVGQSISYSMDAHGITSASVLPDGILTYVDKNINPSASVGNHSATGILITHSPYQDSYVMVEVNGLSVEVGDGAKDKDAYFSGNNGLAAASVEEIRSGDQLYWNGEIAGYDLEIGDEINLIYEAKSDDLR